MCVCLSVDCVGYEPADRTVHPPPQNCRGWVYFFRTGVSSNYDSLFVRAGVTMTLFLYERE